MKNLWSFKVALLGLPMLLIHFAGTASASPIQFENSSNFNGVKLGKDTGTAYTSNTGTYTWNLSLPTDFDPWDNVFSASLAIQANKLAEGQNLAKVSLLGTDLGSIAGWNSSSPSTASDRSYSISIADALANWTAGTPLLFSLEWSTPDSVTTSAKGKAKVTDNWLLLQRSTFSLAYENLAMPDTTPVVPAGAPVPAPASLLLLGAGLASLGTAKRRWKK